MTDTFIRIESREVLDDIRSAAWLESELHEELPLHRRHEMADICEENNIEKIWRVLGICDAELRVALQRILAFPSKIVAVNAIERPGRWEYPVVEGMRAEIVTLAKEKIHDYFVARAMADRAAVIIPVCSDIWQTRAEEAMAAVAECAATAIAGIPVRRRLSPF